MSKAKTAQEIEEQIQKLVQEKKALEQKKISRLTAAFMRSNIREDIERMNDKEIKEFAAFVTECYKRKQGVSSVPPQAVGGQGG